MTLVWENPPPLKTRVRWLEEAAQLRTRPTVWARITECSSTISAENMARGIRVGRLNAFNPVGAYDARSHGRGVWAAYLGDGNLPT